MAEPAAMVLQELPGQTLLLEVVVVPVVQEVVVAPVALGMLYIIVKL
jgi:hypothetical protein